MGYRLLSFQPAAFLGDDRRWHEDYRDVGGEHVWRAIEAGAGSRIDFRVLEHGDVRCNRTAYGAFVGPRWYPMLDGTHPRDLAARDTFFRHFGATSFTGVPPILLAARVLRVVARNPRILTQATGWIIRALRRVGPLNVARHGVRPVTLVMHQFMDAADVAPAWELLQQGILSPDPHLRSVQERLQGCNYAMAHPEDGVLVPACAQHGVYDPVENASLRQLLPLTVAPRVARG